MKHSCPKETQRTEKIPPHLPFSKGGWRDFHVKIYKPWILVLLMPVILLFLFSRITLSQDKPADETATPQIKRPYKLPPNLMQYFKDKHNINIDVDGLVSNIQETKDGPLGGLLIRSTRGMLPKAEIQGATREERARAIAMAFMREEAALFDIPNIEEIREAKLYISKGLAGDYINIYYERYVGDLLLAEVSILVTITPDEKVDYVDASLVPTPPELYHAVKKETLSKEQVIKIIERDLAPPEKKSLIKVHKTSKVATWRPPYVIWGITASIGRKPAWGYAINAFTGEILNKGCTAIPDPYFNPNFNPCD